MILFFSKRLIRHLLFLDKTYFKYRQKEIVTILFMKYLLFLKMSMVEVKVYSPI